MRANAIKKDTAWTTIEYRLTYRAGWEEILAYTETLFSYLNNPQILTSHIVGVSPKEVSVDKKADIQNIPEAGVLVIRGANQIYLTIGRILPPLQTGDECRFFC